MLHGMMPQAVKLALPALLLGACAAPAKKKNWYDDLPNVKVLRPGDKGNQAVVDVIHKKQNNSHFGKDRYAILLTPGTYSQSFGVNVGYYTSVIGVGANASAVQLAWVTSENGANGHATNNFWRSVEGVTVWARDIVWAVSQAAPIRRSVIKGNLHLSHKKRYSSGGFMADVSVHGKLFMGTQQQWFFRNVDVFGGMDCPSGWNYVFVGQRGLTWPQQGGCSGPTPGKVVSVPQPFAAEKPFLVEESDGWFIHVPKFVSKVSGASGSIIFKKLKLEDEVFITRPGMTDKEINKGMKGMKGLLITPGIYELYDSIVVKESGFVVLGIGFPTLVSTHGRPAIRVNRGLHYVRVAGLLLEAGTPMRKTPTEPMLLFGDKRSYEYMLPGAPSGLASDIFVRVGSFAYRGCALVRADTMMEVNNNDVVLDHLWLWHADHDDCGTDVKHPGKSDKCHSTHGLVVNGRRVTSYGLAAEHTVGGHMLQWNGEEGDVYFYQSEAPYHQKDWGSNGYVGYSVAPDVQFHVAHGVGVYVIASYLKEQHLKTAFLLPPYAKVYNLFNVTIGGTNQFKSLACVPNGACYFPEKCTPTRWPMRCWRGAFPRQRLPPAAFKALDHQKALAKKKLVEEAKRKAKEAAEKAAEKAAERAAAKKRKAEEEERKRKALEERKAREKRKKAREEAPHAGKPNAHEEILRDQVSDRGAVEDLAPQSELHGARPGRVPAAGLAAMLAVGLVTASAFAVRYLVRRRTPSDSVLVSNEEPQG